MVQIQMQKPLFVKTVYRIHLILMVYHHVIYVQITKMDMNVQDYHLQKFYNLNINDSIISSICSPGHCCINNYNKYINNNTDNELCAKGRNMSSILCSKCNDGLYELICTNECGKCNKTNYEYIIIYYFINICILYFIFPFKN